MSATFEWTLVRDNRRAFKHGTSSYRAPLLDTFGSTVTTDNIPTLKAMHRATGQKDSLWFEIAETLERLQGDDYDKKIAIEIRITY